jgi:hypothetical protein
VSAPDLHQVVMRQLPVQLWAATQEHVDELLREFTLMSAGRADSDHGQQVPLRLVRLVAELKVRFAGSSDEQRARLFAAAAAGDDELDLVYRLPAAAGPASAELARLFDEADAYCRAGLHLLTLATPPEMGLFRRWYLGQVQDQLAGAPPVPWPLWAASRSDEVEASAR